MEVVNEGNFDELLKMIGFLLIVTAEVLITKNYEQFILMAGVFAISFVIFLSILRLTGKYEEINRSNPVKVIVVLLMPLIYARSWVLFTILMAFGATLIPFLTFEK